ncbi:amino acid permease [Sulfurimonas sp. C5]|uniref:APC family permease n=1 Tax=Sulfurimonas sp. C5 TaxID=3036947 RepID=UPI002454D36D|nr:amino acid permease [Sulfurimonas sp. C5]MDH4944124.1 amino acid permease [Sulfurimonas sp. C5]
MPLKRDITLPLLVFYGLGNILGAGIYVLVGKVASIAGYYAPISFVVACVVVFFTALTYSELSARFPYSAGEALYAKEAFNSNFLSISIGVMIALGGILSSATIVNGFNGYISTLIEIPSWLLSILLISVLCFTAIVGISKSVKIASLFTIVEIIGLFIIIYYGFSNIEFKAVQYDKLIPDFEISSFYIIALGAFLAFYAFIGFEDMVNIAEEVKDPTYTLPKAILLSLIISTTLYFLVALISILAIEPKILSSSKAPLSDVYTALTGNEAYVLTLISSFAVINGALIQIIMVSRLFYGMANNNLLPSIFATIYYKTSTPVFATVIASLLVFIFALWLPIITLASLTSFFIFIIFTLMNLSLIKIKLTQKKESSVNYPIIIPIIGTVVNIILLVIEISSVLAG